MAAPRDLLEVIVDTIAFETRYLRHYIGKVTNNSDPLNKGRVLVQVPQLGWTHDAIAAWCRPRDKHSMVVPAIDEQVEVYFVDGDRSRPVYSGIASEMKDQLPKAFDGKATTVVLWQDPGTGDAIVYDASVPEIRILGKGDNLVTYSALSTAMTNLVNVFNAHTHPPGALVTTCGAGAGTVSGGLSGAPGSSMSADISNAKAKHLRTDG